MSKAKWVTSSDIIPQEPSYLFNGVPDDNLWLLVGDGGVGKSLLECHLAAAVTTGRPSIFDKGEVNREPSRVMLLNAEDSFSRVITHRLSDAGADHDLIISNDPDSDYIPKIDQDLIEAIEMYKPKLLILDPLQAFLRENAAMERRNVMRAILSPLQKVAESCKCSVCIVMHTNKRVGAYGRNRCADSADMWDIARAAFIMGDTYDGDKTKYISQEKNSYGAQIDTQLCRIDRYGLYKVGTTDRKDRDYIHERDRHAGGRPSAKRDAAEQVIMDAIQKNGGSITGKQLSLIASQNDIADKTFRSAKESLTKSGLMMMQRSGRRENQVITYRLIGTE